MSATEVTTQPTTPNTTLQSISNGPSTIPTIAAPVEIPAGQNELHKGCAGTTHRTLSETAKKDVLNRLS